MLMESCKISQTGRLRSEMFWQILGWHIQFSFNVFVVLYIVLDSSTLLKQWLNVRERHVIRWRRMWHLSKVCPSSLLLTHSTHPIQDQCLTPMDYSKVGSVFLHVYNPLKHYPRAPPTGCRYARVRFFRGRVEGMIFVQQAYDMLNVWPCLRTHSRSNAYERFDRSASSTKTSSISRRHLLLYKQALVPKPASHTFNGCTI